MKVIAYDPSVKINDSWVEQVRLDALLNRSEIVTLHVHLTPETRGMSIDGQEKAFTHAAIQLAAFFRR